MAAVIMVGSVILVKILVIVARAIVASSSWKAGRSLRYCFIQFFSSEEAEDGSFDAFLSFFSFFFSQN
jgi:hypothetical protein